MLNIGIPKINEFFIGGMLSNEAQVWPNKESKDFQAISTACCSPDWNVTMFENKLLKVQKEISENANFSLIALKAKAPPSLEIAIQSHAHWSHILKEQNTRDHITLLQ